MLRKSLLLAASLCLFSAPMAMAAENNNVGQGLTYGICTTGPNGSGNAISWVINEGQCRNSSNGQSWVENGLVTQDYQYSRRK